MTGVTCHTSPICHSLFHEELDVPLLCPCLNVGLVQLEALLHLPLGVVEVAYRYIARCIDRVCILMYIWHIICVCDV